MKKLDFLIAGVQKGGTTALWHFLSQHPEIAFGSRKELHFFDDETRDWDNPSYLDLHREYAQQDPNHLWGDATPIYTFWPPSMARIHEYNRNIKLIVTLRDPVERAYSHWRMETVRGAETLSFSDAIREGRKRLPKAGSLDASSRVYSYLERGFYAAQMLRLLAHFSNSQVLLLTQTQLKLDFESTLLRIDRKSVV